VLRREEEAKMGFGGDGGFDWELVDVVGISLISPSPHSSLLKNLFLRGVNNKEN
jgi:hypothetical protein